MSAPAEWAITRTFPINNKLSVTMTAGPGGFTCEWSPTIPRELKKKERNRYRAGRELTACRSRPRLGGNVLVVEV